MEKFSYSTQPHVAPLKSAKSKYRDEGQEEIANKNIMYDARVIRGNTYATKTITSPVKDVEPSWKKTTKKETKKHKFISKRISTPPPVDGRSHMDMQTDEFLEELTDRPIEVDMETQTQPFMDRPPSPLFVRAKTGLDVETQILAGDLFDFDLEVEPILEVLVGKTIHVSMLELLQEEELDAIRLQQEEYEAIRNVEIAEVQRLEAEARRKADEKARRIAQETKRVEEKRFLEEKIAARSFSRQYLGLLHNEIFEQLENEGAFYDPVEKEIEDIFLVDLVNNLKTNIDAHEAARIIFDELIEEARQQTRIFEQTAIQLRNEYKAEKQRELREKNEEISRLKSVAEAKRLADEKALEEGDPTNEDD